MIRVGLFYSVGPHLNKCICAILESDKDVAITLFAPPGHSLTELEATLVSEVVTTELVHYSPKDLEACLRLLRRIRTKHLDEFVVMFDSLQLCLLASMTGVKRRRWCDPQGRLRDLRGNVATITLRDWIRRTSGAFVYAAIWTLVRILPVRGGDASRS